MCGRQSQVALASLFVMFAASGARATILFQQSPDYYLGYYSDIPGQQIADDFSLGSGADVATVEWWGGYASLFDDDFTLRFYADASGQPGVLLASYAPGAVSRSDTGTSFAFAGWTTAYFYSYALSTPFAAMAGEVYWLSILNGDDNNWIWADKDRSNLAASRVGDGGSWSAGTIGDRAFTLTGETAVPEPASLFLLGAGLAALRVAQRRRRT